MADENKGTAPTKETIIHKTARKTQFLNTIALVVIVLFLAIAFIGG